MTNVETAGPLHRRIVELEAEVRSLRGELDAMNRNLNATVKENERLRSIINGKTFVTSPDEPTPKQAYWETREAPHCPTCDCGSSCYDPPPITREQIRSGRFRIGGKIVSDEEGRAAMREALRESSEKSGE